MNEICSKRNAVFCRMLGVAQHTKVGKGNQISPFGPGWVTNRNGTY
jgi:hypothetical protein